MSCPCNPKTGPDFDPDREGPSEADLCRFGDDDADYFFEDELGGYGQAGGVRTRPRGMKAWVPVITGLIVVGFVLIVAGSLFRL